MQQHTLFLLHLFSLLPAPTLAHGVVTSVTGANGVSLPGLSLIDGTPRDCASPRCGSEADTSIIRQRELGTSRASALGRTQGGGPVDAAAMMALFMDGAGGNSSAVKQARAAHEVIRRGLLDALTGGAGAAGGGGGAGGAGGAKTAKGTVETGVKAATGVAASDGLPTTSDDGTLSLTYHQVNQDGAGPLTAMVDATSGGTDPAAFKTTEVTKDVPGLGVGGLSGASTMDFPVEIKMPAGMTCQGSVGGMEGVCVARVQNGALAGPFGGSVVFTQSAGAKRRAVEYGLAKKRFARGLGRE
ncbi:hypothetical protein GE09DRAFT_1203773 [Coniochaeta sp. 2T2.1]|nr:hypothetical protein GE09DRAFT_1203773 [Coniochaeta sp. 2T2.1]